MGGKDIIISTIPLQKMEMFFDFDKLIILTYSKYYYY